VAKETTPPVPFIPKDGNYQKSCELTILVRQLCSPSLSGDDQLRAANCESKRKATAICALAEDHVGPGALAPTFPKGQPL
jgi:hypothetical protein